jgi:hypothetical protein
MGAEVEHEDLKGWAFVVNVPRGSQGQGIRK